MSLCYVTAFLDIGREQWSSFSRTFDTYFENFKPHVDMFRTLDYTDLKYDFVIFIDKEYAEKIRQYCENIKNIKIFEIDNDFMIKNIPVWSKLEKETEIMNSSMYKNTVSHRLHFPENNNPRYTLINHAKIDFVNLAMNFVDSEFFCWVDFGYFQDRNRIPRNPLDVLKLDKERINYTTINQIDDQDKNILYTLQHAPEKVGGFFFFGSRKSLQEYQKLYHSVLYTFQNLGIADDDQHIALRCYFIKPELFRMHHLGIWHRALMYFQLD